MSTSSQPWRSSMASDRSQLCSCSSMGTWWSRPLASRRNKCCRRCWQPKRRLPKETWLPASCPGHGVGAPPMQYRQRRDMMAPYRSNVERDAQPASFSQSRQASLTEAYCTLLRLAHGRRIVCHCAAQYRGAEQFWQLPQTDERDVWLGLGNGLHTRCARDLAEWPVSAL